MMLFQAGNTCRRCMMFLAVFLGSAGHFAVASEIRPAHAAIASAHPLATRAGLDMLARGGNAFDAAIAVSAVLAVVEPASSGIGGGGFYLLHLKHTGKNIFIDARETAPSAASRDMYLGPDGNPVAAGSTEGPRAAAIPGEPAALGFIAKKYGRLPLRVTLEPAIRIAQDGFPLYERLASAIRYKQVQLAKSPEAAAVFLDENLAPLTVGSLIRQPALARTLQMLATSGTGSFYRGAFANMLVSDIQRDGGIWSVEDLARYHVIEREPLTIHYRDATLVMAPPPSSGGMVLGDALNILSGYDFKALDHSTQQHLYIESLKRAFRDRAEYLGDPDFVHIPVTQLLSVDYAAGQRTSIRLDRTLPSNSLRPAVASEESPSTTHFSILDKEGNRVGATLSVNLSFGATYMAPGTGIFLNDTMDDFSIAAGVPNAFGLVGAEANAIASGKRALSSMTPTFVETPRGALIIGSPGGSTIISNVLLDILNWLDGKSAKEIVTTPRLHHQYLPDVITVEPNALDTQEREALERRGHVLKDSKYSWGNTQLITWDFSSGQIEAASDPRGFGLGLVVY